MGIRSILGIVNSLRGYLMVSFHGNIIYSHESLPLNIPVDYCDILWENANGDIVMEVYHQQIWLNADIGLLKQQKIGMFLWSKPQG